MKAVLETADKEAEAGMKILKGHYFVKKISATDDLREDLEAAIRKVRLHQQGKIKLKTAREVSDEL